MDSVYICFSIKALPSSNSDFFEKAYQEAFKPLMKFLYANPDFKFSFSFSGPEILYFKKKHSEFFKILSELIARKQCEILGGGFYNPVLPLLYPVDRNGQIELLSSELRKNTGKRPRGITLFADCWDSSLVSNLQTCGIEYVLLEDSIIPDTKQKYLPVIMSDLGKSIEIFPHFPKFFTKQETTLDFLKNIRISVEKTAKKDVYPFNKPDRIVNIVLDHEDVAYVMKNQWFSDLRENLFLQDYYKISTVSDFRKINTTKVPAFIPCGITKNLTKWIDRPFFEIEPKEKYHLTVFDFMQTYPQSRALYNRMLYVSMLINQFHGDKMKKKTAREKMWASQNGDGLLCNPKCTFLNINERQQSYRHLMDAEKIIRTEEKLKEAVLSFDYNGDGNKEYVCRMNDYFSCINLNGGSISELEVIKNTGNYCDNFSRMKEFDGNEDGYFRGIFVNHIFSESQFEKYINGDVAGDGIFSKIVYSEVKFNGVHREVQLKATANYSGTVIELLKKYVINSSGMNVQYILRNIGSRKFSARFIVESNFADLNFESGKEPSYKVEAAHETNRTVIEKVIPSKEMFDDGVIKNVNAVLVTDTENDVSFTFEPNETSDYCFYPLTFSRPNTLEYNNVPVGNTLVSSLFWNLEIDPGKETEKNLNFTIFSSHKKRR